MLLDDGMHGQAITQIADHTLRRTNHLLQARQNEPSRPLNQTPCDSKIKPVVVVFLSLNFGRKKLA